ncbi:MAG TPA: response regulator [Candidatus Omnitrophota bacterium]|nr:response regulator [Candidatus Omnitrophota bacterium]
MKRILIVEDDRDMINIYKDIFTGTSNAFSIDYEVNAPAGLTKLERNDYDLIILDIIMEPMTGDSFFLYARNKERSKNTPILIVSVLSRELLEALRKMNHVRFVKKPIKKEDFLRSVNDALMLNNASIPSS